MAQGHHQPTPMEDAIIGLTALDLSAFTRGLHIAGTFNIVDFNGRVNGQLVLRCQPLEEIPTGICPLPMTSSVGESATLAGGEANASVDSVIDQFEQTLDLTHLNLGQAIKRKFTELEGISQRLRARLGDVTGAELKQNFNLNLLNEWQPIENEFNDNELDDFEHDLNTQPLTEENEEAVTGGEQLKPSEGETNNNPLEQQGKSESVSNKNSE